MTRATKLTPGKKKKESSSPRKSLIPALGEVNIPPDLFQEFCWLIYGQKGIGKTTMCSQLTEKTLVCMFEDRINLPIRMVNFPSKTVEEIENGEPDPWETFKGVIEDAFEDEDVDCLVIDSADMAWQACLNSVCKEQGVSHPSDVNDYGATWNLVKEEFRKVMESIRKTPGKCLVFTSHCTQDRVELNTGKKETLYGPTCSGAALMYLKQSCDFVVFYGKHGSSRAAHVRWTEDIWTACGVEDKFMDSEGKIAAVAIPSPKTAGKALVSAFQGSPVTDVLVHESDIILTDDEEEETPAKSSRRKPKKFSRK